MDATPSSSLVGPGDMSMNQRRWNWHLWAGFVLCLAGFATLPLFARFPVTRDVPWVNFLLFGAGLAFLLVGLRRAFGQPQQYRGKIAGSILGTLSLVVLGVFLLHRLLPDQATTRLQRSTTGGADGAGIRTSGYGQPSGLPFRLAFQPDVADPHAAKRSAPGFLSWLLVTFLQLRVTGYRKAPDRD